MVVKMTVILCEICPTLTYNVWWSRLEKCLCECSLPMGTQNFFKSFMYYRFFHYWCSIQMRAFHSTLSFLQKKRTNEEGWGQVGSSQLNKLPLHFFT